MTANNFSGYKVFLYKLEAKCFLFYYIKSKNLTVIYFFNFIGFENISFMNQISQKNKNVNCPSLFCYNKRI